ncbi:MAG: SAM-dependent methyltransferase [Clostridium sartagoforme]|nr:SAM-dependent methyltransferase [Clostridium sartagoforme]
MFLLEYIKNPRKVGAIAPSSKYLAYEMINAIDFNNANCIVEYGPGTGIFTEKILARAKETTIIILIEVNKKFYNILNKLYGHKRNVIILNDSAENIKEILKNVSIEKVDYIISGLPFASLPDKVSDDILNRTSEVIGEYGEFITFQYTLLKEKYIRSFFEMVKHKRVIRNIPPAYVLRCNGEK